MTELEKLEQAIVEAEERKREYIKGNPVGEGDKATKIALYTEVEHARKALRAYKIQHNLI